MEFVPFPKIPRLNRAVVVTEKIDGTNASIYIAHQASGDPPLGHLAARPLESGALMWMVAGSRTRWISPSDDNFGFAAWARHNADELFKLGPGHHFGEWWGQGIQRNYGQSKRRFSLFNPGRWGSHNPDTPQCCSVVPVLQRGRMDTVVIDVVVEYLRKHGSVAAPGFMRPEGVIVWHEAARAPFKATLEADQLPKGAQ